MKIEFPLQKTIILLLLAMLIIADAGLALYAMKSSSGFPRQELAAQKVQMKLLKADIQRARTIQQGMPQTKADCERFENALPSASAGYSSVTAELTEVANQSGLQIASLGFHSKELPGRNLVEIEVDATVNGDYKGVVRFLNGLQRSKNHYAIDGLTLASEPMGLETHGALRVGLHIRSYFRNTA
jgi:type IV pilus assembly protein PilO